MSNLNRKRSADGIILVLSPLLLLNVLIVRKVLVIVVGQLVTLCAI